jgi:WD40 repeat protein
VSLAGTVTLSVEHEGAVQAIAFSPDGTRFASGGGDSVLRVRAVGTGPPLDVPSDGFVSGIAFGPDGAAFVMADLEVFLRDSTTGAVIWQGPVDPGNSVNAVRFTPDGRSVVAATDTVVVVLDASTGAPRRRITVDRPLIADLDLSRDGTRIALAIDERHGGDYHLAGSARVVELSTGKKLGELVPDNAVFAVAFGPDGDMVL